MRRIGVLVAAIAALCMTACSPDKPIPAPTYSETALPTQTFADDLGDVLFNDVPNDYVAVPEETGPLTLDGAVAGSDDPQTQRARLLRHGFQRGYSRSWTTQSGTSDVILAFVYEFASPEGAQADRDSGIADARTEGDSFFDVPAVAGATGITKVRASGEDQTFQAVLFVRGARLFLVAIGGPSPHTPEEGRSLAAKMDASAR